jgi:probable F420-dependent oxidoreductase
LLLSVGIIPRGRFSEAEFLTAAGRGAEAAGLSRVWLGDRTVYPLHYESAGDLGREFPWDTSAPQLEGLVAMSWLLASTATVGVGISVMVLPLRQPVVLARQLASLDHLSGGRVTFGVGIGGVLEEYDAVGVERSRRGARADEYLEAMQRLWTEEHPSYSGEFVSFPEIYCSPKPFRPGGLPVWIGGHTETTLERVARFGAGLAAGSVSPERARDLLAQLRQTTERVGRDPQSVGILVQASAPDRDALRRLLAEHREAGVSEVIIPARGRTPTEVIESTAAAPDLLD